MSSASDGDDRVTITGSSYGSGWFWDIVQRAARNPDELESILLNLPSGQVRRFALEFHDVASALWTEPYIGHLTHTSEDDVADVSYWVVSQGGEFYAAVRVRPEILAQYETTAHADRQTLAFVADSILDDRFGDEWNLLDDYQDFADSGYTTVSDYWEARQAHKQ